MVGDTKPGIWKAYKDGEFEFDDIAATPATHNIGIQTNGTLACSPEQRTALSLIPKIIALNNAAYISAESPTPGYQKISVGVAAAPGVATMRKTTYYYKTNHTFAMKAIWFLAVLLCMSTFTASRGVGLEEPPGM